MSEQNTNGHARVTMRDILERVDAVHKDIREIQIQQATILSETKRDREDIKDAEKEIADLKVKVQAHAHNFGIVSWVMGGVVTLFSGVVAFFLGE